MATTPRAGIINLGFKDVSQMAQNIADNDPWKLGIEAAGKVLTDREKHILYQRALADVEGRERPEDKTAGELISSGIDKAGDAFSWLGEKAGNGIDKLRALLPTDTIEKSYEEGELTEDGINVSFPTTVVGKDKEIERPRREVGGKFDWTFPNKGYNTEFPTTVVGAPEDTKEPAPETAPIAGTEMAPESDNPFEATKVAETKIKAPRMTEMEAWSEMNRLNPQRAAFDWNRIAPKGNGAAGTVQARLEHDSKLDQEIAVEAAALRKDMLANGWTSSSPEFLDRYATIMDLEAQKYVKGNRNELAKLIGLSDKEFAQDQAKTKAELDAKKQQRDAEYKLEQQDLDALKMVVDISSDTFAKAKDVPVQLNKVQGLLAEGIENNNPKAIDAAAKILIQSFDNSAVLGNEIGMLANEALEGKINSLINKIANGTTYTKEDVKNLWAMAEALKKENDRVFDEASKRAQTTYKSLRGKESPALNVVFNAYKSLPTTLNPDFDKLPESFIAQWGNTNIETQHDKKTTPSVGKGDSRYEAGSDLN